MKKAFAILMAVVVNTRAVPSPPTNHPSFHLDSQSKRALVEKAATVKAGDSYQSVTNKLGTPTCDQVVARKENSRVIGRTLKYYAVVWESGIVNEFNDELVDVFLDEQDCVRSVSIKINLE